jgi:hypothetical protein
MSEASPADRRLAGQIGAHTKWANTTDRTAATAAARAGLEAKLLAEAGGDPLRAASLRKAYFARMALASVKARRKSRELADQGEVDAQLDALASTVPAAGGNDAA